MSKVLQRILKDRRLSVNSYKTLLSTERLTEELNKRKLSHMRSLINSLARSESGIIAEFKRRSPSKKWINENAIADAVCAGYDKAGASAISVLTEPFHFAGLMDDLIIAAENVKVPVLQKDFVIDEYQIINARLLGASAILLIAAALTKDEVNRFTRLAHELGLEVLLELHDMSELDYITPEHNIIGVNNRNLNDFVTDVQHSFEMAKYLPKEALWVSESGLDNPQTVIELRQAGYRGFLIGETFMRSHNPGEALEEFIQQVENK